MANGSTVRKDYYAAQREFDYESARPQRQEERQVRRHAGVSRLAAFKVMLCCLAICAGAIGFIYLKAQITYTQRAVNALDTQIAQAQRVAGNAQEMLNEAKNIRVIMERAQALGMGYPQESDISYIDLDAKAPVDTALQNK